MVAHVNDLPFLLGLHWITSCEDKQVYYLFIITVTSFRINFIFSWEANKHSNAGKRSNTGLLRSTSLNRNIKKKKSRSSRNRRVLATTDPPNTSTKITNNNHNDNNVLSDMSDGTESLDEWTQSGVQQVSEVFKYASKVSKSRYKCHDCFKVQFEKKSELSACIL